MQKVIRILIFSVVVSLIFCPALCPRMALAADSNEVFKKIRNLKQNGKSDAIIELLVDKVKTETDLEKKSLEYLLLAISYYQQSKLDEALEILKSQDFSKSKIEDYAYYYRALIEKKRGDFAAARKSFANLLDSETPQLIALDAKYNLALMSIQEKKFKEADVELKQIIKKWKFTEKYPSVLWQQMLVQKSLKQNYCKAAKEIYSKFPTYIEAKSWGYNLAKNQINGANVNCQATPKEQSTRIRYLQLGGDMDRALTELKDLRVELEQKFAKSKSKAKEKAQVEKQDDETDSESENKEVADNEDEDEGFSGLYSVDAMISQVLIAQGKADEALKIILGYYEDQGNRSGYLQLLAKAAGRLGEYQAAASAFDKIYRLSPKSKVGKQVLFQSAFLSYQFQDYDGAARKFSEFIQQFPGSELSRDSQWYLAWLKYLRGDFDGAYHGFAQISSGKNKSFKYIRIGKKRKRRKVEIATDTVTIDRAQYWMGMSLLKLEKTSEARSIFEKLSRDPSIGYYAVASYYRLSNLPQSSSSNVNADSAQHIEVNDVSIGEDMTAQLSTTLPPADMEFNGELGPNANFNNAKLAYRFERAKNLALMTLDDLCRLELAEIEKHTKTHGDLKQLMELYQNVQSYFRSSYIGEVSFSVERVQTGLIQARNLWEAAYPRAFDSVVMAQSKSLGIHEELIWSIMRAESHYRQDARSPVGAMGLMQLMPFTASKVADLAGIKDFDPTQLIQPEVNIKLGSRYLQRLFEKYTYVPLIAASYNAGPHRVASWLKSFGNLDMDEFIEHIPFFETRNYVKRVVRNYQIYALLYNSKLPKQIKLEAPKIAGEKIETNNVPDFKSTLQARSLKWLIQPVNVRVQDQGREVW